MTATGTKESYGATERREESDSMHEGEPSGAPSHFGSFFRRGWIFLSVLVFVAVVAIRLQDRQHETLPTLQTLQLDRSSYVVSHRAENIHSARDDLLMFRDCSERAFDAEINPSGCLSMVVAENNLMHDMMLSKLSSVQSFDLSASQSEWILNYGDMGGHPKMKASMALLFEKWIDAPVDPNMVRVQTGAGSMLSQVSYILGDSGDTLLVTAPFYSAFRTDFGIYGHLRLHACENASYEPIDRAQLDACFASAPSTPRIFVLCNPHNPTGTVYTPESVATIVSWARENGMHVVSDEIYAMSVFPGEHTTSVATILHQQATTKNYLGDYVHVVAGLSKDWGMSGFRVGTLFTHNQQLLQALDSIDYYQSVSQYTQLALIDLFSDEAWIDSYIAENQARLHETYLALKQSLELIGVPLRRESKGGLFAWADFSMFLKDGQTENELWHELFDNANVLFTTGESCTAEKPGIFRIVYPWPKGGPQAMRELGRRLLTWKANRS